MSFPIMGKMATKGNRTATAGTAVNILCEPHRRARTVITTLRITALATQHTVTILRPQGKTTVVAAAAAGQAVLTLAADPGINLLGPNGQPSRLANNALAASDVLVFELPDGTFYFDTVSSVAVGTGNQIAVTMTNNLPTNGLVAGGVVWDLGVAGDSDPKTGAAFEAFKTVVSVSTLYQDPGGYGLWSSFGHFEPLLINNPNATAADVFDIVDGVYMSVA